MEAAADAKRIAAMTIPGNEFNGLVEVMEDAASLRTEAVAVFDLNGRRITSRADVDRCDLNKPELYKALRDRMAKDIASEILIRIAPKT